VTKKKEKDGDKLRKERNKEVLDKYRRGESLSAVPPDATFFPPRPIIRKSAEDIKRLYGEEEEKPKKKDIQLRLVEDT
jgi:hypothetical protein